MPGSAYQLFALLENALVVRITQDRKDMSYSAYAQHEIDVNTVI